MALQYRKRYRFSNGYGASVVCHEWSYGYKKGLFEMALLKYDSPDDEGKIIYDDSIGFHDVRGHLDFQDVADLLKVIQSLS